MIGHNHLGKNGRFGNQMFQYAATKGIAAACGYDFIIPDGPRTDDEFVDEEQQHKLFMAFKMPGLKNIGMLEAGYKQESSFRYDEELATNCPDNINLYGYFQSERYFFHIEEELRKDFEFRDEVKKLCDDIWKQIVVDEGHSEAISLHVRRTDHLIKPTFHPVLPISYYEEALAKLPKDIPVFVFTDDPVWATFSWWGAWLAGHDNVIGPKLWFGPDGEDPTDIFIDRWEYLDV